MVFQALSNLTRLRSRANEEARSRVTMRCHALQSSIAFQPVPRDHRAWPWEIGNDVRVAQSPSVLSQAQKISFCGSATEYPERPAGFPPGGGAPNSPGCGHPQTRPYTCVVINQLGPPLSGRSFVCGSHLQSTASSIGFQPVPRDHRAWPWEIGNDVRVAQSRRSVQDTGYIANATSRWSESRFNHAPQKKEGCLHSLPLSRR
jgi:hypothetical protein